jgi:predicted transcriptional regulator
MGEKKGQHTLVVEKDQAFLDELSEYLDILGNPTRLRILTAIETVPKDIRTISREIETSYENTKKHLDKLLMVGVIRKEAGMGAPTSKGIHLVWKYSVMPGGIEAIIQNLGLFSNLQVRFDDETISERIEGVLEQVSGKIGADTPVVVLLGGPEDGRAIPLKGDVVAVGRADPAAAGQYDPERDIVLPEEYGAVTRISRPHCRLVSSGDRWQVEDCGSTGGTYLNTMRLDLRVRADLHDGSVIELGKGAKGARLVFRIPKEGTSA